MMFRKVTQSSMGPFLKSQQQAVDATHVKPRAPWNSSSGGLMYISPFDWVLCCVCVVLTSRPKYDKAIGVRVPPETSPLRLHS